MWKERLPENRGNIEHTTVAAFLPWRGSRVDAPRPLTARQSRSEKLGAQVDLPMEFHGLSIMGE